MNTFFEIVYVSFNWWFSVFEGGLQVGVPEDPCCWGILNLTWQSSLRLCIPINWVGRALGDLADGSGPELQRWLRGVDLLLTVLRVPWCSGVLCTFAESLCPSKFLFTTEDWSPIGLVDYFIEAHTESLILTHGLIYTSPILLRKIETFYK